MEPTWDGPAFAKWLRRWKEHEKLDWPEISRRSGLHTSTLHQLARGKPQKAAAARGQTEQNPGVLTLARLAEGLGLDLAYVLAKGGLHAGELDRWESFSDSERTVLHHAVTSPTLMMSVSGAWDDERERLVAQLKSTLTEEIPA